MYNYLKGYKPFMSFGKRLSAVRKERKVNQGELAAKAGVHPNLIGRYERNEAVPSVEVAAKIAGALNVSLDYLAGKSDYQIDQTILDFVVTIQQLPTEDKQHILYSIEGLIQHAKTRMVYKK